MTTRSAASPSATAATSSGAPPATPTRSGATTRRRDASCRLHQPVPECRARRPSKRLRPPQHARRVPVHKSPRQSQPQPQPLRPRRVARLAERVASALAVKLNPTQSQATSRTILTPMSTQTNVVNEVATATATAMIPGTMLVVTMVKLEMLAMPLMTQFPVAHRSTSLYRPANPTRSSTIASRQSSNCLGFRSQLIGAQLRDGHRWSDAVQCSILLTCLSDEAADVFNELWQATPGLTVDQGLASLTEKYSTKIGEAAIRDRIRQATRRADESYESYAQRLLTMADALPGSRCIETNAIAALEAFISTASPAEVKQLKFIAATAAQSKEPALLTLSNAVNFLTLFDKSDGVKAPAPAAKRAKTNRGTATSARCAA
ncbi:hypothetical protein PF003_g10637 [Phytophthora fragariae]|nr:hypothetical protein PF003_g10637 [Phytophthora fragariae]